MRRPLVGGVWALALSGNDACEPCDPGKFSSKTATADCTLAARGHFVADEGATAQKKCAPGKYAPGAG